MGPKKEIKITIAPDGNTTVEAVNFKGIGCKAATKPFEDALGVVTDDKDKPEIRLTETTTATRPSVKPQN
jgi:hypothetical protein